MQHYDPTTTLNMFPSEGWTKAAASNGNGTGCVEFNQSTDGEFVGIRDSKQGDAAALLFSKGAAAELISFARAGELGRFLG